MILGISTGIFTILHVIVSLIGLAAGIVVTIGLLRGNLYRNCNLLFLIGMSLTSLTGFAFPNTEITPGIVVGILVMIALALAACALHIRHLEGRWRAAFVLSTLIALYLNVFVLVIQLFRHIPLLRTSVTVAHGSASGITQFIVLAVFTYLSFAAVNNFRISKVEGEVAI